MKSFEDILNGNEPAPETHTEPQAEEPAPAAPTPSEAETPPEKEAELVTGEEEAPASEAAPPAAEVNETLDKKVSAFQRKAEDETRKRQDYEKQLEDARRELQQRDAYIQEVMEWQAQQKQHEQPEIDLLDPSQQQAFIQNQVQPQIFETRVLLSQELYRNRHPDYDEMEEVFSQECDRDPSLRQKLLSHPVPAKLAYEEGKRLKLMREMADPDAYKAKIREELMAELAANQQQQQPAPQPVQTPAKPVPQPPKSLAGVPSAPRDAVKHPWKGPTPLKNLLD